MGSRSGCLFVLVGVSGWRLHVGLVPGEVYSPIGDVKKEPFYSRGLNQSKDK